MPQRLLRTLRCRNLHRPGFLGRLATCVGTAGANIGDVRTVWVGPDHIVRDLDVIVEDAAGLLGEDGRLIAHHRLAVVRERPQKVELLLEHAFEGAQLLDVGLGDGRHDTDLGFCDSGERSDLSRLVRAHFEHDHLRIFGGVEQRQRQANSIVQVSRCGVDPA